MSVSLTGLPVKKKAHQTIIHDESGPWNLPFSSEWTPQWEDQTHHTDHDDHDKDDLSSPYSL